MSEFKITFAPMYYFVSYSKQLEDTTAQLKRTSAALEEAKQRTDALLYQMLPVKVANQLRDGNKVEAGEESIIKSKKGHRWPLEWSILLFLRWNLLAAKLLTRVIIGLDNIHHGAFFKMADLIEFS